MCSLNVTYLYTHVVSRCHCSSKSAERNCEIMGLLVMNAVTSVAVTFCLILIPTVVQRATPASNYLNKCILTRRYFLLCKCDTL
uniref:Uncharacterized protein n=1 Tax=Arion vulgaris TaxID=1028688 RepID=A0A0B6YSB8_9EUPU